MKPLVFALILFPNIIFADSGISMSYRSIPAYVRDDDGTVRFRAIETAMLTWFMDDTIKGRDKDDSKPIAWLGWLDTRSGAGYTMAINLVVGNLKRNPSVLFTSIDLYGIDLLMGKRLFVIPHLFHVYGKMGPSIIKEKWNTPWGYAETNVNLGAVVSGGMQIQVLKGVKFFTEAEFRGYGPVLSTETSASVTLVNKLPFTEKEISDYYKEYDPHQGEATVKGLIQESLRFGIRFTF
tara:strand:- start:131 stop:841 length:711 start_codon:yes stop_codon:yes gene_type:complete